MVDTSETEVDYEDDYNGCLLKIGRANNGFVIKVGEKFNKYYHGQFVFRHIDELISFLREQLK